MTSTTHSTALQVGDIAPDFTLPDQFGHDVTLSSFRGDKNVVLVFYPFAFTGICAGEMCEIRDNLEMFANEVVQVLTVSCDSMFTVRAWADREGYFFPMLSDFWPHGEVTRAYGVLNERTGAPVRGTFLIDRDGVVRWTLVKGPGEQRDFSPYHSALADIA